MDYTMDGRFTMSLPQCHQAGECFAKTETGKCMILRCEIVEKRCKFQKRRKEDEGNYFETGSKRR